MTFKDLSDIEREHREKERESFKDDLSTDVVDILKRVSTKSKTEKKNKRPWFMKIIYLLAMFGAFMLVLNFVLVNVWLIRFFIKSLFFS
jgi:hypothetical protein